MVAVRFKRVAEAFGDAGRVRLCESSSGSDHSPPAESLSDLVNSFLERGITKSSENPDQFDEEKDDADEAMESNKCSEYYETAKNGLLKGFFVNSFAATAEEEEEEEDDEAKSRILAAVERALREVGNFLSPDFNRRLMARLRYRGFDAGLCKSKWEKTGSCPNGYHEYIDVMLSGNRYIVEVSLAKEFEIARPTPCYEELLNHFPQIFVGKADELKQIVKVMCKSMKKSMKKMEMSIPPWRRRSYVHAKWFSSYKRTTNEFATTSVLTSCNDIDKKSVAGFVAPLLYVCRSQGVGVGVAVPAVNGFKMGNLAAALQDTTAAAAVLF